MANMKLTAEDGHTLDAYVAEPANPNGNAVVIIQEIFGVNQHIRRVTDDYAKEGYWAIAPALFDRVRPGIELGYGPEDMQEGMKIRAAVKTEDAVTDVAAAMDAAAKKVGSKKRVAVVGYCWGGTLAWLAATRLEPGAAVGYYGGMIAKHASEDPECAVMLHFGKLDAHIPESEIDKIRQRHPKVPIFMYDAGHGFNCDMRKDYEPKSATLAKERSLEFIKQHLPPSI
jgi:carboxymethylenebutenolidase